MTTSIQTSLETKHIPFEIKEVSENSGAFSGYGSIFGNEDQGGDIVEKGAFKNRMSSVIPVLWQHNPDEVIGKYKTVIEDDRGLYVEGELALKTQKGAEAYELLKMKAVSGLSIGYHVDNYEIDKKRNVRVLKEVTLWEVSIVTFPMNTKAKITNVKDLFSGGMLREREFEQFLRESGFSRSQAKAITAHGFKSILRDAEQEKQEEEIINLLRKTTEIFKNGQ